MKITPYSDGSIAITHEDYLLEIFHKSGVLRLVASSEDQSIPFNLDRPAVEALLDYFTETIAIHAARCSRKLCLIQTRAIRAQFPESGIDPVDLAWRCSPEEETSGRIVAVARVICHTDFWRVPPEPFERQALCRCDGSTRGLYLESIRKLAAPVPCRGFQGAWTVLPDVLAQVEAQLEPPKFERLHRGFPSPPSKEVITP